MIITNISKVITYRVYVKDENGWQTEYIRNNDGDWSYELDIGDNFIEKSVDWGLEKKLEELFQKEHETNL